MLGGMDAEMSIIKQLVMAAITDGGLTAELVLASAWRRGEAQYQSELDVRAGDVWVECAPADGGRAEVDTSFSRRIDHHQPGDSGYGLLPEAAFEASALCQVLRLLLSLGVCPHVLGLHDVDDPAVQDFPFGFSYTGIYGYGWGKQVEEGEAYGKPGFHWFQVPQQWVLTGALDHDPVTACRGGRWGYPSEVRKFLLDRALAEGQDVSAADLEEALRMIEAAPVLPGHPTVYDLRGVPELTPAERDAARQVVLGTGGRLGAAAFHAVVSCLPGHTALNWGEQGHRPQGRHLGLIGDTSKLDVRAVLEAVGAIGVYGAPGKACGGYIPPAASPDGMI